METLKNKLLSRVLIKDSGCWEWQGSKLPRGYPRLGKNYMHRVSYEIYKGAIPAGMTVDHICFNPPCVNPDHLQLLSPSDNLRRQRKALTDNCKRGHVGTLVEKKDGHRYCLECSRIRALERTRSNPEKNRRNAEEWRKRNPDRVKANNSAYGKTHYKENRDAILAKHRAYYAEHKERILSRQRLVRSQRTANKNSTNSSS